MTYALLTAVIEMLEIVKHRNGNNSAYHVATQHAIDALKELARFY